MFRESAHCAAAIALASAFALEMHCEFRAIGGTDADAKTTTTTATATTTTTTRTRADDAVELLDRADASDVERGTRGRGEDGWTTREGDDDDDDDDDEARKERSAKSRTFMASNGVQCAMLRPRALRESRRAVQAWAELGVIMFLFWFCDRSGAVREAKKSYDRDLLFAVFALLGTYGWKTTLKESKTHAPLHREQTEEMKGWMQVLFLLYHYFDAGEMYNLIRVFIAAYVWMTGFGNFSFYYVKKDFSAVRFAQMMWRLNFFVFVTCAVMKNDYMLYYICPMHTLFTLLVYGALAIAREKNSEPKWIYGKFIACFAIVAAVWEIPGAFKRIFTPFTFLFRYVNPAKPDVHPLHEWQFRSGLDRYVWIYGMACAYFHPKYELTMKWIDERSTTRERMMYQGGVVALASGALYWWWVTFFTLDKVEYNKYHPYTSWIPITAFFVLRNSTKKLRENHIELFCICGKVTLETYIAQFHIWLSTSQMPNAQPKMLMSLVPGYPLLNLMVCSYIYIGISHRIFDVTNVLKSACIPSKADNATLANNAIFGGIVVATALGLGTFTSLMFTGKT